MKNGISKAYDLAMCEQKMLLEGWTQRTVATRAKVSDASVSNFLAGKNVRKDTAALIIRKGLGLRMEQVVRGEYVA